MLTYLYKWLLLTEAKTQGTLPTLEELQQMRPKVKEDDNYNLEELQPFIFFADKVLPQVTGPRTWKNETKATRMISEVCSISNEAFALLVLESNWDKWDNKAEVGQFTKVGGGQKAFDGWTQEGLERYNELCYKVQHNRRGANAKRVESLFREWAQDMAGYKPTIDRGVGTKPGEDEVIIFVEDDSVQSENEEQTSQEKKDDASSYDEEDKVGKVIEARKRGAVDEEGEEDNISTFSGEVLFTGNKTSVIEKAVRKKYRMSAESWEVTNDKDCNKQPKKG